jgi:TctA family transporter
MYCLIGVLLGTLIGVLPGIAFAAPALAEVALKFGPSEYFSLMVLGLIAATVLAHGSVLGASGTPSDRRAKGAWVLHRVARRNGVC